MGQEEIGVHGEIVSGGGGCREGRTMKNGKRYQVVSFLNCKVVTAIKMLLLIQVGDCGQLNTNVNAISQKKHQTLAQLLQEV